MVEDQRTSDNDEVEGGYKGSMKQVLVVMCNYGNVIASKIFTVTESTAVMTQWAQERFAMGSREICNGQYVGLDRNCQFLDLIFSYNTDISVIVYDNACNLAMTLHIHDPYLLLCLHLLVVDRFHFLSHINCGASFSQLHVSYLDTWIHAAHLLLQL